MTNYKELRKQYMLKQITEDEYKERQEQYIETLVHLYCRDLLTKEELNERMKGL